MLCFPFQKKNAEPCVGKGRGPLFLDLLPEFKGKKQLGDGSVARLFKGKNPGVSETIN